MRKLSYIFLLSGCFALGILSCETRIQASVDKEIISYTDKPDTVIISPTDFPLNLDDYHGGAYSLKMQAESEKNDTVSMDVVYYNSYGEEMILQSIPLVCNNRLIEYTFPPTQNEYNYIKLRVYPVDRGVRISINECSEIEISCIPQSIYTFHAHLGFIPFAPENTAPSFIASAKAGFKACITNPIESADGTLYCYHEDHAILCYNGACGFSHSGAEFHEIQSSILDLYDAGLCFSNYWINTPLCKLEEFFEICCKYDMAPTFSIHPTPSTKAWANIKTLTEKYGLTDKLVIKAYGISAIKNAYQMFGDDIRGYVNMVYTSDMMPIIESMDKLGIKEHVKVGIETGYSYWNEGNVKQVIDRGYFASSFSIGTDGKKIKNLISWGVTDFTTNYFPVYSEWMGIKTN